MVRSRTENVNTVKNTYGLNNLKRKMSTGILSETNQSGSFLDENQIISDDL